MQKHAGLSQAERQSEVEQKYVAKALKINAQKQKRSKELISANAKRSEKLAALKSRQYKALRELQEHYSHKLQDIEHKLDLKSIRQPKRVEVM